MGVKEIFGNMFGNGSGAPAPLSPQQAANPSLNPNLQNPTPTPPGNIPPASQNMNGPTPTETPAPANNPTSPLDAYKDLWQPAEAPKNPDGSPVVKAGMFNLDPAKIMETAGKLDFKKAIKPEQLTAIQAGGPEAMAALLDVMQQVGQLSYANSVQTNAQLMEAGFGKARTDFTKELPDHIKAYGVGRELSNSNPALNHPAAQPIIDAVRQQMIAKFPGASEADIAARATEYVTNFANAAIPKQQEAVDPKAASATDWSTWA